MRTLSLLALLVVAAPLMAVFNDTSAGLRPKRSKPERNKEYIVVKEEMDEEEQAAARRAARRLPYFNADGEVTIPKAATTRSSLQRKDEVFAPPEDVAQAADTLATYFCEQWSAVHYEAMYYAMTPAYRKRVSFKAFIKRFEADMELTGGLKSARVQGEVVTQGKYTHVPLTLTFHGQNTQPRTVKALAERTPEGFRLADSGLIPLTY